jgi:hypothetical protein
VNRLPAPRATLLGPFFGGDRRLHPQLEQPLTTTRVIMAGAQRIASQLNDVPAGRLTRALRSLTDQLVSNLIPLLDAEARVVHDLVGADIRCELASDHRQVRSLTERLEMITENVEGQRRRVADRAPIEQALRAVMTALAALESHQRIAFGELDESLRAVDEERVVKALEEAAITARNRIMLIDRPDVPATASTVLRTRPDLDTAYAISLAALKRPRAPSRPELSARMETSTKPRGGRA